MDLYAKNFFLTYPRCDLHPEYAIQGLQSIPHSEFLLFGKVAQETHEDGSLHLHAILGFSKKIRIRDERYFDLHFGDDCYHGNYQGCKSVKNSLAYIDKEGGPSASFGEIPSSHKATAYARALASSKSADEFYQQLLATAPRDAVLYGDRIRDFGQHYFGGTQLPGFEPRRSLGDFRVPTPITDWVTENVCINFFYFTFSNLIARRWRRTTQIPCLGWTHSTGKDRAGLLLRTSPLLQWLVRPSPTRRRSLQCPICCF